jgi:homoserine O-acetyltransferase/O-succinyltransferase
MFDAAKTVAKKRQFGFLVAALLVAVQGPTFAHWPDQPAHQIAELGDFQLESGAVVHHFKMSYVTHGKLNAAKDNAVLIMHGWGLNHHQFDHFIGPGLPFDTDIYFIICTDELGNSQTTFEHSTSPSNSGLKMKFPQYNGRDKVKAEYRLITEVLGIRHLLAITGYSSGAAHTVQFAVSYPEFMDAIFPQGGGALSGTQGFFYGASYMSALQNCTSWNDGNYDQNPKQCASSALSTFIPYFYTREWWDQYIDSPEAYARWRKQWGEYYLDIQDARDLYYRMLAAVSGIEESPGSTATSRLPCARSRQRRCSSTTPKTSFSCLIISRHSSS